MCSPHQAARGGDGAQQVLGDGGAQQVQGDVAAQQVQGDVAAEAQQVEGAGHAQDMHLHGDDGDQTLHFSLVSTEQNLLHGVLSARLKIMSTPPSSQRTQKSQSPMTP